jgi:AcrR family transcriptional regulator
VPRAGLTPDVVVAEAATLVDEAGAQGLTLAAVARRCGVALPSLYKHVGGLDDLHGRLAVSVARELAVAVRRAATGRAGRDALTAVSAAYRDYARSHPGRYHYLVMARPDDPAYVAAATEVMDVLGEVFSAYGVRRDDVVDAARLVRSTLHGFVSLEEAHGFGLPRDVDGSYRRVVASLHVALTHWSTGGSPA